MSNYFETTITVKVLSQDWIPDSLSLDELAYQMENGDLVGIVPETVTTVLTAKEAAVKLSEYGSTPGFFNLDADGKELDCEY